MARLSWNADNIGHIAKHEITPEEVEQVFRDHRAFDMPVYGRRFGLIGRTEQGRILMVVYERRSRDMIRVITAHVAKAREVRRYFQQD